MTPAIGPNSAEYPTSHPNTYELKSLSSFHGIISTPNTPVIIPPVRNEIRCGLKFAKSFDGDTTLAATLVVRVAISSAISATNATSGSPNRPNSSTGSQIGWPNNTTEADVTATPMNE